MNMRKWIYFFSLVVSLLLLTINTALSHPGGTAADGCHYCRTNCDKWGVPWYVRHCHYSTQPFELLPIKYDFSNSQKLDQADYFIHREIDKETGYEKNF